MSGKMSLWEYGALTHGWAERNKSGTKDDGAPVPTEDDWVTLHALTAETVARADGNNS